MTDDRDGKNITGYCEPLSLRAGEDISLMASSHMPCVARLDLVRIICGDGSSSGPGFREYETASELAVNVDLTEQFIRLGSYGEIDLAGIGTAKRIAIRVHVLPTQPTLEQTFLSVVMDDGSALEIGTAANRFVLRLGGTEIVLRDQPASAARWYQIEVDVALIPNGEITWAVTPLLTRSPGRDLIDPPSSHHGAAVHKQYSFGELSGCLFAGSRDGTRFDGRIARPEIEIDDVVIRWDFSLDIGGRRLIDVSGHERHGVLHQLPTRGVTGPSWDGSSQSWLAMPSHYDAIHFHSDDLYDAEWAPTARLTLPAELESGIYAFRLRSDAGEDRVPFFVRPAAGTRTADVALLMPSCTYMAYANHRMLFQGADFVSARSRLSSEHEYVRDHCEVGLSCYEKHADGSGVMFSSRRRPVLQLRPGADRWNFTPDTNINAFLGHLDVGHDVIADEDVHAEGIDALSPYRVLVTGSHPEYWSTPMLDALEAWLRDGGRLLYLGGNGFYWRVAFSDFWPGAIELRRTEDGVRNWQTEPGESYHAFNGEYGGLWRRLGRAPNQLVGVGFVAQGFERSVSYTRKDESYNSRAAWIFEGVEEHEIGTSGLGGGAAGQEIDRYDIALGSPPHAIVLASATKFGPDMIRVKEEFDATVQAPSPDPYVCSDIVFFETPSGGAVFSVGSISWFGALARNGYDNDIARITSNVIQRFADPTLFDLPSA